MTTRYVCTKSLFTGILPVVGSQGMVKFLLLSALPRESSPDIALVKQSHTLRIWEAQKAWASSIRLCNQRKENGQQTNEMTTTSFTTTDNVKFKSFTLHILKSTSFQSCPRSWNFPYHPQSENVMRLPKNLSTLLKALRQMFRSNEDPPLELEAEPSNWRPMGLRTHMEAYRDKFTYLETIKQIRLKFK